MHCSYLIKFLESKGCRENFRSMHVKHHLLIEKKELKKRRKGGPRNQHSHTLTPTLLLPTLSLALPLPSSSPFAAVFGSNPSPFDPLSHFCYHQPITLARSPLILDCSEFSPGSWQGELLLSAFPRKFPFASPFFSVCLLIADGAPFRRPRKVVISCASPISPSIKTVIFPPPFLRHS